MSGKKIAGGGALAAIAAASVMLLAPAAIPPPKTITVSWELAGTPLSNSLASFVQSRTNLAAGVWLERTNFPYREGTNAVSFPRDKPCEFFRVGWRFR